jgi:hypothetical protein
MLNVFQSIFPIILITALGYLLASRRWMSASDIDGLSRFVFSLALPFLLFDSLVNSVLPGTFDWDFFLAFYGVSFLIFGLGVFLGRRWFHLLPAEQAVFGLGASYSNLVIIGLPVISTGLGDQAVFPLLALVSIQSLLLFPLVSLFSYPNDPGTRLLWRLWGPIKRAATNPLTIGLALGFLVKIFSIQVPSLIEEPIHLVSQTGLPCALIVLGASFYRYRVGKPNREAFALVGLKMMLQPLLVWVLVFVVMRLDPLWASVAVMAAGMPTGINVYMMAEREAAGHRFVSAAIWMSTLLAVITQAGLLSIFLSKG